MCIIAGYTGAKRAAPILIEMLKKTEYIDGGLSTGIATIHEGKLYVRKVLGDVDTLLQKTDALDLPGTTGIIHSRTSNNFLSHAHPQLSADGQLAVVDNGTMVPVMCEDFVKESNGIMAEFVSRGIKIKSEVTANVGYQKLPNGNGYHETELWPLYIGERVKNLDKSELQVGIASAMREILSRLPADVIIAGVHANVADTITVSTVTRPMAFGIGKGEVYMCTVPFGMPENVTRGSVIFLPPTSTARITPRGVSITATELDGTAVEEIDFRTAALIRRDIEKRLKVGEENAIDIYDLPFRSEWASVWHRPPVECRFQNPKAALPLKPTASLIYEGLWSFYKEGRLKMKLGTRLDTGKKIMKFWLDR